MRAASVDDEVLAHISAAHSENINFFGAIEGSAEELVQRLGGENRAVQVRIWSADALCTLSTTDSASGPNLSVSSSTSTSARPLARPLASSISAMVT